MGRLKRPLLGMPVSIRKQWISATETSSGFVGLPKSTLNWSMLDDKVCRYWLGVESDCRELRRSLVRRILVEAFPVEWIAVRIAQHARDF